MTENNTENVVDPVTDGEVIQPQEGQEATSPTDTQPLPTEQPEDHADADPEVDQGEALPSPYKDSPDMAQDDMSELEEL